MIFKYVMLSELSCFELCMPLRFWKLLVQEIRSIFFGNNFVFNIINKINVVALIYNIVSIYRNIVALRLCHHLQ